MYQSAKKASTGKNAARVDGGQALPPSIKHTYLKALRRSRTLTMDQFNVIAEIIDHYNIDTGVCCPAVSTIASTLGMSDRGVQKIIKLLSETLRYIDVEKSTGGRMAHGYPSNQYRPRWEVIRELDPDLWEAEVVQRANRSGKAPSRQQKPANDAPGEAEIIRRLEHYRDTGTWSIPWGPMPGDNACAIPSHLLRRVFGADWELPHQVIAKRLGVTPLPF